MSNYAFTIFNLKEIKPFVENDGSNTRVVRFSLGMIADGEPIFEADGFRWTQRRLLLSPTAKPVMRLSMFRMADWLENDIIEYLKTNKKVNNILGPAIIDVRHKVQDIGEKLFTKRTSK